MGLQYFKRYRMEADLRGPLISPSLPRGYRFVPWSPWRVADHGEVIFHSFRGAVDSSLFECLGDVEASTRLMESIVNRPGFLSESTWLIEHIASPARSGAQKGELCGAIQGVRVSPKYGAVQNVGVIPFHRGLGLGRSLVLAALRGMQLAGAPKAYLEVTGANSGAVRLYESLGFRRAKTLYRAIDAAAV